LGRERTVDPAEAGERRAKERSWDTQLASVHFRCNPKATKKAPSEWGPCHEKKKKYRAGRGEKPNLRNWPKKNQIHPGGGKKRLRKEKRCKKVGGKKAVVPKGVEKKI